MAYEAREAELFAMDAKGLLKICEAKGTNPYVKEIMVDRVIKKETSAGKFARQTVEEKKDTEPEKTTDDAVEAVLANETNRKKKLELQRQQEEAIATKKKELR